MESVIDKLPKPAIIAHRGSSAHAPENTLSAFELAISQLADAIELDAQLTADGHVVVFHDQDLERLTNGKGKVSQHTLDDLLQLRIISPSSGQNQIHSIPTLDETFAAIGHKTYLNVEMKHFGLLPHKLPHQIISLVEKYRLESRVLLSSFNPLALIAAHKTETPLPLGLLIKYPYHTSLPGKLYAALIDHDSVHLPAKHITRDVIQGLHRAGKSVFVYTVNDPGRIRQLARWGIDGIFTDDPLSARSVIPAED